MNKIRKAILAMLFLIIGLIGFILQIFVFNYPDGTIGLIVCIMWVMMIITTSIILWKNSNRMKKIIMAILDCLF